MMFTESALPALVKKYNVPGPRYTSYPTALQFTETVEKTVLEQRFKKRSLSLNPISLYIHIPFCFSLCWYCGCTKIITKDQDRGDVYLDYLEKEMILIGKTLHPQAPVKQIHFGGGTPTFLTPTQLLRLGSMIHTRFKVDAGVEFSVEIDPRKCDEDHIKALKKIGCNRASLGVQDTNVEVQKAIHRIQPFEQTRKITGLLKKYGITNINFDLIYGLPKQSPSSFEKTIEDVSSLHPSRLAIYSYAHIPSVMPSQKLLNEKDFPTTEEKLAMLVYAIKQLPGYGYSYIGMDHFARTDDELNIALQEDTLHRNFQGYSTHAELEMIALGMSGISQGEDLYYQNEKDLGLYYDMLDKGTLPVKKMLLLTDEDKIRRKIIMEVMCRGGVNYERFFIETGIRFKELFHSELEQLHEPEADGLLVLFDSGFKITNTGRLFLRNIAMIFDAYLPADHKKPAFSETV